MNPEEKNKLLDLRIKSKMGEKLSKKEQAFCQEMFNKYPDEYPKDSEIKAGFHPSTESNEARNGGRCAVIGSGRLEGKPRKNVKRIVTRDKGEHEMKLYILERTGVLDYDETAAVIVRAKNEKVARKLAQTESMDEGKDVWSDPARTTCKEISPNGKEEVLLVDFRGG